MADQSAACPLWVISGQVTRDFLQEFVFRQEQT